MQANSTQVAGDEADKVIGLLGDDRVQADWKGNGLSGQYKAAVSGDTGRLVFTVLNRPVVGVLSKLQLSDNS